MFYSSHVQIYRNNKSIFYHYLSQCHILCYMKKMGFYPSWTCTHTLKNIGQLHISQTTSHWRALSFQRASVKQNGVTGWWMSAGHLVVRCDTVEVWNVTVLHGPVQADGSLDTHTKTLKAVFSKMPLTSHWQTKYKLPSK